MSKEIMFEILLCWVAVYLIVQSHGFKKEEKIDSYVQYPVANIINGHSGIV